MYEKEHKASCKVFMIALIITSLFVFCCLNSGCANTAKGFGKLLQGAGATIGGAGLDIEQAAENQSK